MIGRLIINTVHPSCVNYDPLYSPYCKFVAHLTECHCLSEIDLFVFYIFTITWTWHSYTNRIIELSLEM